MRLSFRADARPESSVGRAPTIQFRPLTFQVEQSAQSTRMTSHVTLRSQTRSKSCRCAVAFERSPRRREHPDQGKHL